MFYTPYRGFKGSSSLSWSSLGNQPYKNFLDKAEWPILELAIFHASREAAESAVIQSKANESLYEAARGGHADLVVFFISKGASDWNLGMRGAAEGGHGDLVDFFISKGASSWNSGMRAVAQGGHGDLVDFFISKGASSWNWVVCCRVCADREMWRVSRRCAKVQVSKIKRLGRKRRKSHLVVILPKPADLNGYKEKM